MAHSQGQGISCVEVLVFNFYAKRTLYHKAYLLLRSGAVAADGHLGFSRGVLEDLNSPVQGGNHRGSLCPAELEYDLGVLAVKGRFYRQMVRMVELTEGVHLGGNDVEFFVCGVGLSQIEATHIYIVGFALGIDTDNPETKDVGSGIDSEYGYILVSQFCRNRCRDAGLRG